MFRNCTWLLFLYLLAFDSFPTLAVEYIWSNLITPPPPFSSPLTGRSGHEVHVGHQLVVEHGGVALAQAGARRLPVGVAGGGHRRRREAVRTRRRRAGRGGRAERLLHLHGRLLAVGRRRRRRRQVAAHIAVRCGRWRGRCQTIGAVLVVKYLFSRS